jgi:hypothetical protein
MSVALQDEPTPIGVTDAFGDPLGPIPSPAHQANCRMAKLVKAERVIAGCFDRAQPHLLAEAVPVPLLALLVREHERGAGGARE